MAGLDYCSCEICGVRLFYDGEFEVRNYMKMSDTDRRLVCFKCYNKTLKKIDKLEKNMKRGR